MQRYTQGGWFAATLLFSVTMGFTLSCNNYSLLDRLENPSGEQAIPSCQGSTCHIFVSSQAVNGTVTIPGADFACNKDSNKPNSGRYKAMLVDGVTRQACSSANCAINGIAEHIDWVLYAEQPYARPDGSPIGATNVIGLFQNLSSGGIGGPGNGFTVWTGLNADWSITGANCNGWTDIAGYGTYGTTDSALPGAISAGNDGGCNLAYKLYCVEQ